MPTFARSNRLSLLSTVAVLAALGALVALLVIFTNRPAGAQETQEGVATGAETLVVSPIEVDFHEESVVWIYGSGFQPGIEISLVIEDRNGVLTDITSSTTMFPLETNEQGAFATAWTLGDFTDEGVSAEGMRTLWAADENFNMLASAPIAFCSISERAEQSAQVTPEPGTGDQQMVTPVPGDATPGPTPEEPAATPEVPAWCSR